MITKVLGRLRGLASRARSFGAKHDKQGSNKPATAGLSGTASSGRINQS